MRLTIANLSTTLPGTAVQNAVVSISQQVKDDFLQFWPQQDGSTVEIVLKDLDVRNQEASLILPEAVIYLGDHYADPLTGIESVYFGYHTLNHESVPYGFVYLDICHMRGEAWTVVLSHEVLEVIADPSLDQQRPGPAPMGAISSSGRVLYDVEVCDPVQGDAYPINGVAVSNFITPAYFNPGAAPTGTNFRGTQLEPFGVRPGGYFQYKDDEGRKQVDGARIADGVKAAQTTLLKYRRCGRRSSGDPRPSSPAPASVAP
ncbi:hypothetical protein UAJ10_02180 [Nitrospirillum sp. BR 11164]|uniref:hypothetical protein n=1 Tax=Nitrospirillum sp. BR 11164 TaxID=3104324 RepID=UPI002AFFAEB2|nr:hypothetical protein [Nitrospirillum sp. BR 11164]MEA1647827.1 hypothetical protein [Nitrospirillum sp. BR 11164]